MTAVAVIQSPVERFVAEVLPPHKRGDIFRALPAHIRPDRFERNLHNALMADPKLLQCDPRLVYREVSKAAGLGVLIDPQLGEAYLIRGWNGKAKREEPQLRIGYRGLMKLGRQSGDVAVMYAHEVCANDEIICELGDQKKLVHKPLLFGDRGRVIGYYAVVKYKDGETDFEPMTVQQIEEIRDKSSDGWKAFKDGKIRSTPWATSFDEMAKKTVLRRLMKRVPQSPELADAWRQEDEAEGLGGTPRDITPIQPAPQITQSVEELLEEETDVGATESGTLDQSPGAPAETSGDATPAQAGPSPEDGEAETGELPVWDEEKVKAVARQIAGDLMKMKTLKAVENLMATRGTEMFEIKRASEATYDYLMGQVNGKKAALGGQES